MLTIKKTTQFKKDFKRVLKQGYDIKELEYLTLPTHKCGGF